MQIDYVCHNRRHNLPNRVILIFARAEISGNSELTIVVGRPKAFYEKGRRIPIIP